jgi:Fic family protein
MTHKQSSVRAGRVVRQIAGYRAFVPAPLPPDPPLAMDAELIRLLSDTDRALGRLDGVTSILPNADLFVAMYVRQEAVFSSQIEGTQSTLEDVLQFEVDETGRKLPKDVREVVNYVSAMNHGLDRLKTLPLSNRLIREIHDKLMIGVRGSEKTPGEFRRTQNWIGPPGCTLNTATFVPPAVTDMTEALGQLERFLHDQTSLPHLIHCGLVHAQFESIHPFLDGNGRVGRLLITLLLCERGILQRPLLYLSTYLKARRTEYYDRLTAVRYDGDWEGWLKFFLTGVFEVSVAAARTARQILELRESHRKLVEHPQLLDYLFEQPIVTVSMVKAHLGCTFPTASKLIAQYAADGLLREITGRSRNRAFRYSSYLRLFESPEITDDGDQAGETEADPDQLK